MFGAKMLVQYQLFDKTKTKWERYSEYNLSFTAALFRDPTVNEEKQWLLC